MAAPFAGDRFLLVGWLATAGYGGVLVARELIQHAHGTLGTIWPAEMVPAAGAPLPLKWDTASGAVRMGDDSFRLTPTANATAVASFALDLQPVRISCRVDLRPDPGVISLVVGGDGGCELKIEPSRRRVQFGTPIGSQPAPDSTTIAWVSHDRAIEQVEGLDRPFGVDLILWRDRDGWIIDAALDVGRTLITFRPTLPVPRLEFRATGSAVTVTGLQVRPLSG
jgi:hypothetical protein